jgi:hypothetical protein
MRGHVLQTKRAPEWVRGTIAAAASFSGDPSQDRDRRDFLALMGIEGVVFVSALPGCAPSCDGSHAGRPSGELIR